MRLLSVQSAMDACETLIKWSIIKNIRIKDVWKILKMFFWEKPEYIKYTRLNNRGVGFVIIAKWFDNVEKTTVILIFSAIVI